VRARFGVNAEALARICTHVALLIQHKNCMDHIVIYGPFGSTIFFPHFLKKGTI
jgi:hypothetical protein